MDADREIRCACRARRSALRSTIAVLDFNGAAHRVDDAPELDNCAVAGALHDTSVMHGDGRIDQIASERPQPRQNSVLIGPGKPRIADDIGHQDRRYLPGFPHGATPPRPCQRFRVVRAKPLAGHRKYARGMSIIGVSMAALPCCVEEDVEAGNAAPACRLAGLSTPCRAYHRHRGRE